MALKRVQQDEPTALTGATALVPLGPESSWKTWKFTTKDWQSEAWRLYDIVGEFRFLGNWVGDSVSQARLYVTEVSETGEETGDVDDDRISQLASVPLGTGATRDDNLRLTGIDLAVCGEAYIVGESAHDDSEPDKWYVVTSDQVDTVGDRVVVNRSVIHGGGKRELRDGEDILIRVWRPHPNGINEADSPARAAIPPLREVELLTKREFAELDSRLTGAGVWPLPEGIDFPRGEDDPEGVAGFMAYLQRMVSRSMQDQSSASAMVPHMFTVPDSLIEHMDKLRPITFWSELSGEITQMKDKAIARVANAFEIPSEVLTGLADSNHWTAWAISEEGIKRIKPYLSYIADSLTRGYLRPALEAMGVEEPWRYSFAFDTSPLAVRPNRMSDAMELWDRTLISDSEAVKAGAFSEDQMPNDEERVKMLVVQAVRANPMLLAEPAVQDVLGISSMGISTTSAPGQPSIGTGDDEDEADGPPDNLDDGPPEDNEPTAATVLSTPDGTFNAAAKLMVMRALELAGGRMVSHQERRSPRFANIERHQLHTKVDRPVSREKADKLLEGAWVHIPEIAHDLGVRPDDLENVLHGYCVELLTRGMAHHDDLLSHALKIARGS